jgi:hypothetical protein
VDRDPEQCFVTNSLIQKRHICLPEPYTSDFSQAQREASSPAEKSSNNIFLNFFLFGGQFQPAWIRIRIPSRIFFLEGLYIGRNGTEYQLYVVTWRLEIGVGFDLNTDLL